jgi:hypothetical protein
VAASEHDAHDCDRCQSSASSSRHLSRRHFLSSAAVVSVSVPVSLFESTVTAYAFWWAAALAVASLVAGGIAAHNRRDVTLLMTKAIHAELRVISNQLASLQQATALMLQKLDTLTGEFDQLLKRQEVRVLQLAVLTAVTQYQRDVAAAAGFDNWGQWLAAPERKNNLRRILGDLWSKRTSLELSDFPTDPSAVLTMSNACLAELSLMNVLEYKPQDITARMSDYESYFPRAMNGDVVGTAKHYQVAAELRRAKIEAEMAHNPIGAKVLGAQLDTNPGHKAFAQGFCAWVADVTQLVHLGHSHTRPRRLGPKAWMMLPVSYAEVAAENHPDVRPELEQMAKAMGETIHPGMTGLTIRDIVADEANPLYFGPIEPGAGSEFRASSADGCPLEERDLQNADAATFQKTIRSLKSWTDGLAELAKLRELVRAFNEESARIAFGYQAVRVAQDSLSMLSKVPDTFR